MATLRQAAERLSLHPWISTATVRARTVVVTPAHEALAVGPPLGGLLAEHLDQWSEVYDWTYSEAAGKHAADLDLSGWRASDTGEPYPVEHMRDWLRHTVETVLRTRPRWVLELGCGTGMLLHRLWPHVDGYVGTDVAEESVRGLSASAPGGARILRAAAHEVSSEPVSGALTAAGFPEGRPDCIVLNSVTQCFPDVGYLRAVVHGAVRLVAPGGAVVVGDVRHAGLLREHHAWLSAATNGGDPAEAAAADPELLFDPPVLARLATETGRDVRIATYAKTMSADTELTRYRFDAVLHVDSDTVDIHPADVPWTTLEALRERLATGPVCVLGIPNSLLASGTGASAAQLHDVAAEFDAVVTLDTAAPRLLEVRPAVAAARPAATVAGEGTVHEPLRGFARRRLVELARRELRRAGLATVAIEVDDAH